MSAAATKPRAARKAPAKTAPGSWAEHIAHVKSLVSESLKLVGGTMEKACYDKPAWTLLHCADAEYCDILRELDRQPMSYADAEHLSNDGMWPALSMLAGALALLENDAEESALVPAIKQAHEKLNAAHSALDSVIVGPIAPKVDIYQRDFLAGRDHAIALLTAAENADADMACMNRWARDGKAQDRFALPFLRELSHRPELLEGFAAVLSAKLAAQDLFDAELLALPKAEYEAGEVGADGTAMPPDEPGLLMVQEPDVPSPDAPQAKNALETDGKACATTRAWFRAMEANAILRGQLEQLDDVALYGAAVLTQIAEDHFSEIVPGPNQPELSSDALEIGVRHLNEARAVVEVVYDNGLDDPCLSGVIALLSMGKDSANEAIDEVMARERAK
ncbi:hypothetical protein [Xenophilus sp.]|uniref:hypothetical protein n=1 Tax=Xenophilus sp. TaxID=1873499 RepID=UPI0037DDC40B